MSTSEAQPSEEGYRVADTVMALNYPKTPARENIARIADEAFAALRAQLAEAGLVQMGLYQEKEVLSDQLAEAQKERDRLRGVANQLAGAEEEWTKSNGQDRLEEAQAEGARLTEDLRLTRMSLRDFESAASMYRGARDYLHAQLTAATAREAALVAGLLRASWLYLNARPCDGGTMTEEEAKLVLLAAERGQTEEHAATKALEMLAALARCSPPAAETEGQG